MCKRVFPLLIIYQVWVLSNLDSNIKSYLYLQEKEILVSVYLKPLSCWYVALISFLKTFLTHKLSQKSFFSPISQLLLISYVEKGVLKQKVFLQKSNNACSCGFVYDIKNWDVNERNKEIYNTFISAGQIRSGDFFYNQQFVVRFVMIKCELAFNHPRVSNTVLLMWVHCLTDKIKQPLNN